MEDKALEKFKELLETIEEEVIQNPNDDNEWKKIGTMGILLVKAAEMLRTGEIPKPEIPTVEEGEKRKLKAQEITGFNADTKKVECGNVPCDLYV